MVWLFALWSAKTDTVMLIGVLFGIGACMIWGSVYVAPLMLPDYSPAVIAMVRYLVFGMLSLSFAFSQWKELKTYQWVDWRRATALAIVGNIFYYWLLAEACQRAGASIAGAFTAMIPILVAVIGNLRAKEKGEALAAIIAATPIGTLRHGLPQLDRVCRFGWVRQCDVGRLLVWRSVCLFIPFCLDLVPLK